MKIVITPRGFANYGLDKVKEMEDKGYTVSYNNTGKSYTREQFLDLCKDADGLIVGVELVDKEFFEKCPNIKAVVKFGVGVDNIDLALAQEKNVFVGRCVGSNSRSVAELTITYMLAETKNLYTSIKETKKGTWNKYTGYEVLDKTVGIIGFGAIGKHVATMANGLGMHVIAYDTFPISDEVKKQYNIEVKSLEEIYQTADFVTVHVPLLPETENMISLKEMKMMKPEAVLINAARGGIVNEKDLYTALSNNIIRAAYCDVFTSEPPKEDEPLLQLDNFYLTPHIASRAKEAERRTCEIATKIILEELAK